MATIRNTETNETTELTMLSDSGSELMSDILGNYGVDYQTEDGERMYLLDADGIAWWTRWVEREERIADAFEDCEDQDTIAAYWQAIDAYQGDLERMQDELERILGIEEGRA